MISRFIHAWPGTTTINLCHRSSKSILLSGKANISAGMNNGIGRHQFGCKQLKGKYDAFLPEGMLLSLPF